MRPTPLRRAIPLAALVALLYPATLLTAAPATAPAGAEAVARLEAKGCKLKRDKASGAVTELSYGGAQLQPLTVDDWRAIGQISSLTRVWTSSTSDKGSTPLNDETAALLANLPNVEQFFANGSEMTDDGFKAFAGWTKLRRFALDHWFGPKGNKGYVGAGLAHLKDLPNLEHVRLGGCRVDNAAPQALAQCKSLHSVDLFHTFAVTDDGVAFLKALPNLRAVTLGPQYTTRITDASLAHLGQVRTLEELHVTETWHTYESGFAHLKGCPNLKRIKLPFVLASEADVAKLKADHPNATIEWNMPEPANAEKLKAAHERAKAKGTTRRSQ